jgi:hypothetical protein
MEESPFLKAKIGTWNSGTEERVERYLLTAAVDMTLFQCQTTFKMRKRDEIIKDCGVESRFGAYLWESWVVKEAGRVGGSALRL